jgi:hypothetical protein
MRSLRCRIERLERRDDARKSKPAVRILINGTQTSGPPGDPGPNDVTVNVFNMPPAKE